MHFSYRSDFDVHGLVYWIGTLRRTVQAWSNPTNPSSCVRGVNCISAFRSSKGSLADDEDWCITRRTPKLCYTAAELNASWGIDLGNTRMQVVNYTLRDGEDFYGEMLRSWELQGSNDGGLNWTVIVRHENDTSLTRPHDSATFYVKQLPHNIAFRRIRVLMTGPNARGSQFLNLAGLELYGRLYGTCARRSPDRSALTRASRPTGSMRRVELRVLRLLRLHHKRWMSVRRWPQWLVLRGVSPYVDHHAVLPA